MVQNDDMIAIRRGQPEVMQCDQGCRRQNGDELEQLDLGQNIEMIRGLVENQHRSVLC